MAKVKSKGTTVGIGAGGGAVSLSGIKSVSVSGAKSETIDVSTLDATDTMKEKIPSGFAEPPTISIEVFRENDDAAFETVNALILTPVATSVSIEWPNGTTEVYTGIGFGFDSSAAPGDALSGTITIETTGDPA